MTQPSVVAIVGPTAVGKTALSLALAHHFDVEIVSVDSRQVYRSMDIGTAKPTPQELAQVPHHIVGVADPTDDFSLALFLTLARRAISDIANRYKLPLLVGGTGQYLWALLENWRVPEVPPDSTFRLAMESLAKTQGLESAVSRLAQVDPDALAVIDTRNLRRVIRALEVQRHTGVPWSRLRQKGPEPYQHCIIGLTMPRGQLYKRIDQRVEAMIEAGWVDEVKRLLGMGVTPEHSSMASVGYRELAAYVREEISLEQAIPNTKFATHRFARSQSSWFRQSDSRIRWLDVSDGRSAVSSACELIRSFLERP